MFERGRHMQRRRPDRKYIKDASSAMLTASLEMTLVSLSPYDRDRLIELFRRIIRRSYLRPNELVTMILEMQ
jgi:hypothetical protein